MAAVYDTKAVLINLMRQGDNAKCMDCRAPSPQWASVSFGTFICLSCSGQHRSLGVHLSFVRSLTMDKWTDAQLAKMQMGGNAKCRAFFVASGQYRENATIVETYNTHFAAQYRDKLSAECEGRIWDPSQTPPPATIPTSLDANSSSLRKPRGANSRASSPLPRSNQPYSDGNNLSGSDLLANASKATVDTTYFGKLGEANAARFESLRPSEGGKYGGFGSEGSWTPSQATSSQALPSLNDLSSNPTAALSKGWGFFASALGQASKQINESVVQPGLARAADPNLQAQFSSYVSTATRTLGEGARQGSSALSSALRAGGEFAESRGLHVGDMGASYVEKIAPASGNSYDYVNDSSPNAWKDSPQPNQDFFNSHLSSNTTYQQQQHDFRQPSPDPWKSSATNAKSKPIPFSAQNKSKKADDWDSFDDDGWGKHD